MENTFIQDAGMPQLLETPYLVLAKLNGVIQSESTLEFSTLEFCCLPKIAKQVSEILSKIFSRHLLLLHSLLPFWILRVEWRQVLKMTAGIPLVKGGSNKHTTSHPRYLVEALNVVHTTLLCLLNRLPGQVGPVASKVSHLSQRKHFRQKSRDACNHNHKARAD